MGPLPTVPRKVQYLITATDYFTKWIEAEPLALITKHVVMKFVKRNIFTQFGIPRALISDNGTQFVG